MTRGGVVDIMEDTRGGCVVRHGGGGDVLTRVSV